MPRVSDTEVKQILDTTIDTTSFITAATLLVDQHLLAAGLPTALLKEIERWLAAHLACVRDPRFRDTQDGSVSMTFEVGKEGAGLAATTYGQQVLAMDPTWRLAQASMVTTHASVTFH